MAKELANTEEIGLDESTLMKFFESKTEQLIETVTANKFTFDNKNFKKRKGSSNSRSAKKRLSVNESISMPNEGLSR